MFGLQLNNNFVAHHDIEFFLLNIDNLYHMILLIYIQWIFWNMRLKLFSFIKMLCFYILVFLQLGCFKLCIQ